MADDDNFDIDIYGDDPKPDGVNGENGNVDYNNQQQDASHGAENNYDNQNGQDSTMTDSKDSKQNTDTISSPGKLQASSEPSLPQGTKRKGMDDRPVDPNSTNAVQITELHWWITEDDLRGWCVGAGCEAEVRDITYNEHKVNGKSKGQVYIELASQAAATALKTHIDKLEPGKSEPKAAVATFYHGQNNPYKTLPKDNARRTDQRSGGNERNFSSQSSNYSGSSNFNSGGGNSFRGRGNFSGNRGGGGGGMGGNMGFNGGRGGFQGNPMPQMAGGNMSMPYGGGMNGNFQNFNRGGMMGGGMRGGMQPNRGRGGMGGPGGMMNPMGGMGMGGMPMGGMNMGGGMMGMPGGFQNPTHFNPGFFQGQHTGGGDWGNPHGAKRPRPNE